MENVIRTEQMRKLPKKVAILGAAKSGMASARFLLKKGCEVLISDTCSKEKMELNLASNEVTGVEVEAGGHSKKILEYELIILSPGIPSDIPILKKAKSVGIPIWSEVELAFRHSVAPFIAVTGSTGKSTTVSLIGEIFTAAKVENVVAGNIGTPLISVAPTVSSDGVIIAEISSFQLENIDVFQPSIALVLNLMKNHLDRYESEDDYYSAKKDIINNMVDGNTLIVNSDDEKLLVWKRSINTMKCVAFGNDMFRSDNYILANRLYEKDMFSSGILADFSDIKIKGEHNIINAAAAASVAKEFGLKRNEIEQGVATFKGLSHRLEFVRGVDGVEYYNDSKSTTAESIEVAVNSFDCPIHLIAGGKDKGGNFKAIKHSIEKNVKTVTLIGEATKRIASEWKGLVDIVFADTLEAAVESCNANSSEGDIVLLSPGCSSFDMFDNFEHRGDVFRSIVEAL